jgi:hypothetical protein
LAGELEHGQDPPHVLVAVATVASGGPDGQQEPVAALPGPQRRHGHAGPAGYLADRHRRRIPVLAVHVTSEEVDLHRLPSYTEDLDMNLYMEYRFVVRVAG